MQTVEICDNKCIHYITNPYLSRELVTDIWRLQNCIVFRYWLNVFWHHVETTGMGCVERTAQGECILIRATGQEEVAWYIQICVTLSQLQYVSI